MTPGLPSRSQADSCTRWDAAIVGHVRTCRSPSDSAAMQGEAVQSSLTYQVGGWMPAELANFTDTQTLPNAWGGRRRSRLTNLQRAGARFAWQKAPAVKAATPFDRPLHSQHHSPTVWTLRRRLNARSRHAHASLCGLWSGGEGCLSSPKETESDLIAYLTTKAYLSLAADLRCIHREPGYM